MLRRRAHGAAFDEGRFRRRLRYHWQLTRRVGPAKATELFFVAEFLPADEAAWLGLVNRVFPSDTFLAEVRDLARRIAHGPLVRAHQALDT